METKNPSIHVNEGSYVCEIISPLLNIAMRDLPVNTDIWGAWLVTSSIYHVKRTSSNLKFQTF